MKKRLGLKRGSKEWKEAISKSLLGRRCCPETEFRIGHIPHNKGKKGTHFSPKTEFKKGNKPKNYMGGFKICPDGLYKLVGSKHYKYGKLAVGKYENYARVVWREHHGNITKNEIIFHKDGDIYNNDINNLEKISRAELLLRNSIIGGRIKR